MNNLRSLLSATILALAVAAPSVQAADESPWKFEFHGFVTASMYYQDQTFVNGQGQALLLAAPTTANRAGSGCTFTAPATACANPKSAGLLSGDVRNSRFAFSMAGPKVFDGAAQPRAYLEFDFFGLNGAGTFATEQQVPRLRVGIVELKIGDTNIQVGQQNQLVVTQIPASLSHIANPMTYQAGTIGWRTPGIRLSQTISAGDAKVELAIEAVKNKWNNEAANAVNVNATSPAGIGFGESSAMPMFQARAKVDGKAGDLTYMGYLVGVYHKVDLNGFGDGQALPVAADGKTSLTGYVGEVGGRLAYKPVSLQFNVYTGKATGNMLGSMVVFGDIKDLGYWVSLNGNFTKEFSLHLVYGANSPNETDMRKWASATATPSTTTRLANTMMGGMLKYQDGGYAVGIEGYQINTKYANSATTTVNSSALQIIATAGYFF